MKHKVLHLQSLVAVALCVIMAIAFVGCSNDDDEPENNPIVGTWKLSLSEGGGSYWYCQYNFKSDGTFEVKDWTSNSTEPANYEGSGTYSVSGSVLTLNYNEEETETYRFSVNGNKLTIYDYEEDGPNDFYKL